MSKEPCAGEGPEFGEDIVVDEGCVLDLTVETAEETVFRLGSSICLCLVSIPP